MQRSKRIQILKDYILEHKDVKISEFNSLLDVSESTIRRDLKTLAEEGFIKELYGNVILAEKNKSDIFIQERLSQNLHAKKLIGEKAANLVEDNDFIYIDAGSTTFHMIESINAKNVTVVTNGIHIAQACATYGIHTLLLGGELKALTMAIVGEQALETLQNYNFDACFMGTNGISSLGYSTPDVKEGIVKKHVIKRSLKKYVLSDKTKYHTVTAYVFTSKEECELISD